MALTASEAAALANRLLADVQQALVNNQLLSRLILLPAPFTPAGSTYPDGLAYVSEDGRDGILLDIAKGAGGQIFPAGEEPPKITGIDLVSFKLYSSSGLIGTSLRIESPVFEGTLQPEFENLTLILDGSPDSFAANNSSLAALGDRLTDYFNAATGQTPDYAKTVAELKQLLASQAPVLFTGERASLGQRAAVGGANRDVLASEGDGVKEVLTGDQEADAFYIKGLDFITGTEKLNTKIATSFDDYNALEGDHTFLNIKELQRLSPDFTTIRFSTVFNKSQLKKAAKSNSNLIYHAGTGGLYFNANGKKKDFGNGGLIARFDYINNLRPILSSADFSLVDPTTLMPFG